MQTHVDTDRWTAEMRQAALPAIQIAAEQIDDPAAAADWTESDVALSFETPDSLRAVLSFSRPDATGESPSTGRNALEFDYLRHLTKGSNALLDMHVRGAVLRQIQGRMRDAEIARLSPGVRNPAWASSVDLMTWTVLSHFLTQAEIEAMVSDLSPSTLDEHGYVSRRWQDRDSPAPGLISCYLALANGTLVTDGLEFRLSEGGPRLRVESMPTRHLIVLGVDGVNVPDTVIANAYGRSISRLVDDPLFARVADRFLVRSVRNHSVGGEPGLEIQCDYVGIRCAPAPDGAEFAWENRLDPAAPLERRNVILDHGTLD